MDPDSRCHIGDHRYCGAKLRLDFQIWLCQIVKLCASLECEGDFGAHLQGGLRSFHYGEIAVDMPDGEVKRHRIIVRLHKARNHTVEVLVRVGAGVGEHTVEVIASELPHYQSLQLGQHASEPQLIEQSLYPIDFLAHIFNKENGVGLQQIVIGANERRQHRQVSAHNHSLSLAAAVEWVRGDVVGRERATAGNGVHRLAHLALGAKVGELLRHGGVQTHHLCTVPQGVQRADVAEANQPLGVGANQIHINAIQQPHRAISATATPRNRRAD